MNEAFAGTTFQCCWLEICLLPGVCHCVCRCMQIGAMCMNANLHNICSQAHHRRIQLEAIIFAPLHCITSNINFKYDCEAIGSLQICIHSATSSLLIKPINHFTIECTPNDWLICSKWVVAVATQPRLRVDTIETVTYSSTHILDALSPFSGIMNGN